MQCGHCLARVEGLREKGEIVTKQPQGTMPDSVSQLLMRTSPAAEQGVPEGVGAGPAWDSNPDLPFCTV